MKNNRFKNAEELSFFPKGYVPPICIAVDIISRQVLCGSLNPMDIDEETDMDD